MHRFGIDGTRAPCEYGRRTCAAVREAEGATIGVTLALATFLAGVASTAISRSASRDRYPRGSRPTAASEKITDQVDAAIAWGTPPWPGFSATLVRDGEAFPGLQS